MNKIIRLTFCSILLVLAACSSGSKMSSEEALKSMGEKFYKDYYYDLVLSASPKLSKEEVFNQVNNKLITISASNIKDIPGVKVDEEIELLKDDGCDFDKSEIKITPKQAYEKDDIEVEVSAKCK